MSEPLAAGDARVTKPAVGDASVQEILLRLGQRLADVGRDEEAEEALRRSLAEGASPTSAVAARTALGQVLLRLGRLRSGFEALIGAVVEGQSESDVALNIIGDVLNADHAEGDMPWTPSSVKAGRTALIEELIARKDSLLLAVEHREQILAYLVEALVAVAEDSAACQLLEELAESDRAKAASVLHRAGAHVSGLLDGADSAGALRRARLFAAARAWDEATVSLEQILGPEHRYDHEPLVLAPALEVRASILEKRGEASEAIAAWFESGQEWLWAQKPSFALPAFNRVERAASEGARIPEELPFWRAECLRLVEPQAPNEYAKQLRDAIDVWASCSLKRIPNWALRTRALLEASLAELEGDSELRPWTAALYFERALAQDPDDVASLAGLARTHWTLHHGAVAVWCVHLAWERNPTDPEVIGMATQILLNAGHPAPAGLVAALEQTPTDDPWTWALIGTLALDIGDLRTAEERLAQALAEQPDMFWAYWQLLKVLVTQQKWDDAARVLAEWEVSSRPDLATRASDQDRATASAWAKLLQNRPEEVLAQQDQLLVRSEELDGEIELLLAAAYGWSGDRKAMDEWASVGAARMASLSSGDMRYFAERLELIGSLMQHHQRGEDATKALLHYAKREIERARTLALHEFDVESALASLELHLGEQPNAPVGMASRTMQARILLREGRDVQAVVLLRELLADVNLGSVFPERGEALAYFYALAAMSAAYRHRPSAVGTYLGMSVDVARDEGHADPLSAVVALVSGPELRNLNLASALVALSQGYSQLAQRSGWILPERIRIAAARRQIHRRAFVSAYGSIIERGHGREDLITTMASEPPILLEANPKSFPQMGDTPGVRWMLDEGIPDMKSQLGNDYAPLPGVRIRPADDLSDGTYRIVVLGLNREVGNLPQAPADRSQEQLDDLLVFKFLLDRLAQVLRPLRGSLLRRDGFVYVLEEAASAAGQGPPTSSEAGHALRIEREILALGREPVRPERLLDQLRKPEGTFDLAIDVGAVLPGTPAGSGLLLDSELEGTMAQNLMSQGGQTAVLMSRNEVKVLQDRFSAWYHGNRRSGTQTDAAEGCLVTRLPQLVLALATLAQSSGVVASVGWLDTEDGRRHP